MLIEFNLWPGRDSSRLAVNSTMVQCIASSGNAPPATRIKVANEEFTVCGSYSETLEKLNGTDDRRD